MASTATHFEVETADDGKQVLTIAGDWTVWTVALVEENLRKAKISPDAILDVSALERLDTSGAYLIDRAFGALDGIDDPIAIRGEHPSIERVLGRVRKASPAAPPDPIRPPGLIALLDRAGRGAVNAWEELLGLLSFIGETIAMMARLAVNPRRIRWKSVVAVMEEAGLDALPIVCFLSFFIGLVIAFIGANLLAQLNASVYTVELVGIGMMREFGAVLTAILLAGRTDSAFTAQTGAMKMRQEIDAMRTIGLDPMEALVAPRLIALLTMAPLLTFAATLAGMAFSNVGVAIVHALEYPIGGAVHCSHGEGNGLLLPYCMRFNLPHKQAQFAKIATLLGVKTSRIDEATAAERAVAAVEKLRKQIGIPARLRDIGVEQHQLAGFAEKAYGITRILRVNPRFPTLEELESILEAAF